MSAVQWLHDRTLYRKLFVLVFLHIVYPLLQSSSDSDIFYSRTEEITVFALKTEKHCSPEFLKMLVAHSTTS